MKKPVRSEVVLLASACVLLSAGAVCRGANEAVTRAAAEKAWMVEGRYDAGSSAVVYKGHVYATAANRGENGGYSRAQALCVNLDTGTVAWETKVPCGGYASPLIADGKFFFRAPGQIVMAEATPVAYRELGRATMGVNTYASPIIAGGKLFVRMGGGGWSKGAPGKIACYDLRKQ